MDVFSLRVGLKLEQRLDMFPARERSNTRKRQARDTAKYMPRRIPKDRPLHVRGLHLAPVALDLSVRADDGLRNVDGIVVVFGKAQRDGDLVVARARTDRFHLR